MSDRIYILILNFNTWQDTIECVESVLKSTISDYQIVIIDNFSPNNSETFIMKWLKGELDPFIQDSFFRKKALPLCPKPLPYVVYRVAEETTALKDETLESETLNQWRASHPGLTQCYRSNYPILFMQTGRNLGFAGGNNFALRFLLKSDCDGDVLLLNPDTYLGADALRLLQEYNEDRDFFVCGMSVFDYNSPERVKLIGGVRLLRPFGIVRNVVDPEATGRVDYIYGGAFYSNLSTFRKVGLLPEEYFLYWEEADWCYQAKLKNVALRVCSSAICYDKTGSSIGRGYLAEYYFTYNGLRFYRKNFPRYFLFVVVMQFVRMLIKAIRGKYDHVCAIRNAVFHYFKGEMPSV